MSIDNLIRNYILLFQKSLLEIKEFREAKFRKYLIKEIEEIEKLPTREERIFRHRVLAFIRWGLAFNYIPAIEGMRFLYSSNIKICSGCIRADLLKEKCNSCPISFNNQTQGCRPLYDNYGTYIKQLKEFCTENKIEFPKPRELEDLWLEIKQSKK